MNYLINFYRYTKYKDLFLITLDDGRFMFINQDAFKQLKRGKIEDKELYNKFKEFGLIIDETNVKNILKRINKRYSFLSNGTSLHIIVPTIKCNLRCSYCFAESEKCNNITKEMDERTAIKIVEFIMQSPSSAITIEFQGGEVLLRYDILKTIVEHAKKLNKKYKKDLKITVVSNLTLITEEMIEYIADNNITLCTSLDGPKELHDKHRYYLQDHTKIGTYDIVIKNIKKVNKILKRKNKRYKVNALPTITKLSLKYYKEIIDEYIKNDLSIYYIRFLTKIGRGAKNDLSATYEEYIEFWRNSIEYIKSLREKGIKIKEANLDEFTTKIIENKPTYNADLESPCGLITGQILYYSNGDIYSCNEGMRKEELKIGNVFQDTWKTLFKKKKVASLILSTMLESNPLCDRCPYKPYCGTCIVENYLNYNKPYFYPSKTKRHHTTIRIANYILDKIYKKLDMNLRK